MVVLALYRVWALVGGDVFLQMLVLAMILDVVAGNIAAHYREEWATKALIRGLYRKVSTFCGILFCYIVQRLSAWSVDIAPWGELGIGTAACACYILVEGISIFKNLALMDVSTPYFLLDLFRRFDKDSRTSGQRAVQTQHTVDRLDELKRSGEIPVSNHSIDVIKEELKEPPIKP